MNWPYKLEQWVGKKVLVIGDFIVDQSWQITGERSCPERETVPAYAYKHLGTYPGGAGNVALNCARMGAHVKLLAPFTGSAIGGAAVTALSAGHVLLDGQASYLGADTTKTRVYDAQGDLLARYDADWWAPLPWGLLQKNLSEPWDLLLLSDYQKGALQHVQEIVTVFRKHNPHAFITLNPKPPLYTALPSTGIDLLQVNDQELHALGFRGHGRAFFNTMPARFGIWTQGDRGLSLGTERLSVHVGAHHVERCDPCGAGDSTFAAASLGLFATQDPALLVQIANAAGAAAASKSGTRAVTREDLLGFLERKAG